MVLISKVCEHVLRDFSHFWMLRFCAVSHGFLVICELQVFVNVLRDFIHLWTLQFCAVSWEFRVTVRHLDVADLSSIGASSGHLQASVWGFLEAILDLPSFSHLGATLERFGAQLFSLSKPSWGHVSPRQTFDHVGPSLGVNWKISMYSC